MISMKLRISLFEIRISEIEGYGLSILGIGVIGQDMAIGFNIRKEKHPGKIDIVLHGFFYKFRTKKVIKSYLKSHFKCIHCETPVYKSSFYCPKCKEHMIDSEVIWVEIK